MKIPVFARSNVPFFAGPLFESTFKSTSPWANREPLGRVENDRSSIDFSSIGDRHTLYQFQLHLYSVHLYCRSRQTAHIFICFSLPTRHDTPECGGSSKPSLLPPPDTCNARGHSPNSLVPHVPAYNLLRLLACTSRASALPALAVGKSLNHWASEVSSHPVPNAKCPQAGNLDASFQ